MKYWFLFKELQLRIFVLVTLPIFLLSVYFVIAIDFPVNLPFFHQVFLLMMHPK